MTTEFLQKHNFPESSLCIGLISKGIENFFQRYYFFVLSKKNWNKRKADLLITKDFYKHSVIKKFW